MVAGRPLSKQLSMKPLITSQGRGITAGILLGAVISAAFALTAAADLTNCAPAPAGLVGWWRAEGNGNDSVGTNNASLTGGVSFTNGMVGQAFALNGVDGRVIVPDAPSLNFGSNQDFSIEAWINPLPSTTDFGIMSIVDKRVAPNISQGLGYEFSLVNGSVACRLSDSIANIGTGYGPAGPDLRDGRFHHVAMTVSRNSATGGRLFVDGQMVLTFDPTSEPGDLSNSGPLRIGNHATPSIFAYFKGMIDEVSIYQRALATNEIAAIYAAGSAGKCAPPPPPTNCAPLPMGLVSWWRGEGNGNDSFGSNNASLSGGVSFTNGMVGQAFALNGVDGRVVVPDAPSLNFSSNQNFSIEAWISPLPSTTDFGIITIVDKRVAPNIVQCLGYEFCLVNGQVTCRLSDSIADIGTGYGPAGPDLRDGRFHHVAMTVVRNSTAGGRLYVDGQVVLVFDPTTEPGDLSNSGPLRIGNHPTLSLFAYFKGTIDEVSLYQRALGPTEVAAIYAAGSVGKCPPPPRCVSAPAGEVAWWRAEGNALDSVAGNNGTLQGGVTFATGEAGQAFAFDGSTGSIPVAASPALNVGLGDGFSVDAWIKPSTVDLERPIVEWNSVTGGNPYPYGVHLWMSVPVGYGAGPGCLYANIVDTGGAFHWLTSAGGLIKPDVFQHVGLTYDKSTGLAVLYLNGAVVAQQNLGSFTPQTSYNLFLGRRPSGVSAAYSWAGLLDEVTLYSRPLSQGDMQAIFNAGMSGKCQDPPAILTHPASQIVIATSNATFTVTAAGAPQLWYQWRLNGTDITGATSTSLSLADVQTGSAGSYSVRVTNAFGSVISSNAVLTVNHIPVAQCADVIVAAGANCQADASVNNGSFDPDGDPITLIQSPPGPYSLGTNRVTLTVTDDKGASSSCSALIVVLDRTSPALNCPGGRVLEFQNEKGVVATYDVTATDACSAATVIVTPPSGSVLPIGVTPVQVRAVDGYGNSAQCTFDVTVLGARGVKSNVLAQLVALRSATTNRDDGWELSEAIEDMIDALGLDIAEAPGWVREAHRPEHCGPHHHHPNGPLWLDETHVDRSRGGWVFANEQAAVEELLEILRRRGSDIPDAVALDLVDRLVRCDRLLAVVSIQDAASAGLDARKIAEDRALVAKGDAEAAAGHYANAIEHYRDAWRHALRLQVQIGLNADGSARVHFVGHSSTSYRIEVSADLVHWVPLGTCTTDADGNAEFSDPTGAKLPARFYRAVEQ